MVIQVLRMGISALIEILQTPIIIDGYVISLWALFLFGMIGSMLVMFIIKLFD